MKKAKVPEKAKPSPTATLTKQTVEAVETLVGNRGCDLDCLTRNLLTIIIGNGLLKAYRSGVSSGRKTKQ